MSDQTLQMPLDEAPAGVVPPVLAHRCGSSGLRCHALPPGGVEANCHLETYVVDINLPVQRHEIALNSDRLRETFAPANCVAIAPPGTEFKLRAENTSWGALIEIDPDRAATVFAEATDGDCLVSHFCGYTQAPEVADVGRRLIAHLRQPFVDGLYAESLSLAAIGLSLVRHRQGGNPSSIGNDARIASVIDYVEAHIGEALTVTELAAVACLSPGHFSRTFKATTGEAVWSYVQRRRCERARDMLLATKKPIVQIAFDCGFANQAHLTRQLSARFGATPGAIRRESQR